MKRSGILVNYVNIENSHITGTDIMSASASGVSPVNGKHKWVAVLFCLTLGLLGAYKFYEVIRAIPHNAARADAERKWG